MTPATTHTPTPQQLPRIGVWGLLVEDARSWATADGRAHLQVRVQQHQPGNPTLPCVQATLHYPDHGAPAATAMAAHSAAQRLRRGAEVMVCGEGLQMVGTALCLMRVISVQSIGALLPLEPTTPTTTAPEERPAHVPA
jgi:hypothetical protein